MSSIFSKLHPRRRWHSQQDATISLSFPSSCLTYVFVNVLLFSNQATFLSKNCNYISLFSRIMVRKDIFSFSADRLLILSLFAIFQQAYLISCTLDVFLSSKFYPWVQVRERWCFIVLLRVLSLNYSHDRWFINSFLLSQPMVVRLFLFYDLSTSWLELVHFNVSVQPVVSMSVFWRSVGAVFFFYMYGRLMYTHDHQLSQRWHYLRSHSWGLRQLQSKR